MVHFAGSKVEGSNAEALDPGELKKRLAGARGVIADCLAALDVPSLEAQVVSLEKDAAGVGGRRLIVAPAFCMAPAHSLPTTSP
jgi:hypothetical protein